MLIECKLGYAEVHVAGTNYTFSRDAQGRFVAEVPNLHHAGVILSVEHYRRIEDSPEQDPADLKAFAVFDRDGDGRPGGANTKRIPKPKAAKATKPNETVTLEATAPEATAPGAAGSLGLLKGTAPSKPASKKASKQKPE